MIDINYNLSARDLLPRIESMWPAAAAKIHSIAEAFDPAGPAPVFTAAGRYVAQGWTEWTQGFQYGCALLAFDATDDRSLLELGRDRTRHHMASHVTHTGVHDHGFNNISTYGNLRRLMQSGRIEHDPGELRFYELALAASGAVQATRWSTTIDGDGYIYSFNGPHSLFCDTIRSLRSLAVAHQLGHAIAGENDIRVSLLDRLVQHARSTARYSVFYGEGRDHYDMAGRVAHESIFNTNDGRYRCPNSQQGYSPFSTWTRGLSWIALGYPEQLEWLATCSDDQLAPLGGREAIETTFVKAACAVADFYIEQTPTDGVPYWDTGAPGLASLGDYLSRPAEPDNDYEPVDSSAAAITCQGLLRLGRWLQSRGDTERGARYWQAGLTTFATLLSPRYLSLDPQHQGLLLHTVYHRPRGWDHIAPGKQIPNGESALWGDYHLLEAALFVERIAKEQPYYTFFGDLP
jgi:hypothetical protein